MKSLPNILVFLLIALVAAPLDSVAVSWMALGMESHASEHTAMDSGPVHGHQHARSHADSDMASGVTSGVTSGEEDCDEHCMNCSSHCFTSLVIAASALEFPADGPLSASLTSRALHRASLLYRPPIAS